MVFSQATLTIAPGVEVRFDNATKITVNGKLIANGTANDSIRFTSNSASPLQGSWNGIIVNGPSTSGSQITMSYCHGEYAYHFLELTGAGGDPSRFTHCTFYNNTWGTYSTSLGESYFRHCKFIGNFYGAYGGNDLCSVSHSEFIDNETGARYFHIVDTCYFTGNKTALADCRSTRGCYIVNNDTGAMQYFNGTYHTFIDNTVKYNDVGILISSFEDPWVTFANNTICDNTIYNVKLVTSDNANLSNNCWCEAGDQQVSEGILDGNDSTGLGLVNFLPRASSCPRYASVNEAPSISSVQNYPNPAHEIATVSFSLSLNDKVSLALYDMEGKLVREVKQESFPAGTHTIDLDVRELANGIYLMRLENTAGVITKKIVVLK